MQSIFHLEDNFDIQLMYEELVFSTVQYLHIMIHFQL